MRVLVVDDDLGSRLVAQSAVQQLGHECLTATDGDQAWQMLARSAPDVLITDRDMPGRDGLTLCRQLREREQDRSGYTYVILLTGLGDPAEVTAGMLAGADDYLTKPLDLFSLQARLVAAMRVTALHAELSSARASLARQARTDPLTGLRNRLSLAADLEQLQNVSERHDRAYCIAMCDIDYFKSYNDTYGHPAGDQALRTVAASFTEHVRKSDRVYRYGGEEFLVLLPEQSLQDAAAALERVRGSLQDLAIEHRGPGASGVLTISAGLAASHPDRRIAISELVTEADTALYSAKSSGRNRLAVSGGQRLLP